MRTYLILCVLGLIGALSACTSTPDQETTINESAEPTLELPAKAAALYQEVGATHDTAMLLMAPLERTQIRLRRTLDYLNEQEKKIALALLTDLKKAEEGMMDWMHNFKSTELNEEEYRVMSEVEMTDYLKAQNEDMLLIDSQMRSAIKEGGAFLERYEKKAQK